MSKPHGKTARTAENIDAWHKTHGGYEGGPAQTTVTTGVAPMADDTHTPWKRLRGLLRSALGARRSHA